MGVQDSEWVEGFDFKVSGFHLSLTGQRSKGWLDIRDNILGDSAGRDKHQEGIR